MTGSSMQPEFNHNIDKHDAPNYKSPITGGAIQDMLREKEIQEKTAVPVTAVDKITDKFSDNAGDNALTRYEINQSIVSEEMANEHSFVRAAMSGLDKIAKPKLTNNKGNKDI